MRLPNAASARIELSKLTDYCLSATHPEGRHKARVFRTALGILAADAQWLAAEILRTIPDAEAFEMGRSAWGVLYQADVLLAKAERSATVRTGWIIGNDGHPRLTTCYVVGGQN